jgi:hypothetical protein
MLGTLFVIVTRKKANFSVTYRGTNQEYQNSKVYILDRSRYDKPVIYP